MRNRQVIATDCVDLEVVLCDDGSRTLRKISTGTTWHSESGALAETELVFLVNSGVVDRLSRLQPTRVLEIGFGTGLNFWTTASTALIAHQSEPSTALEPSTASALSSDYSRSLLLDYISVEPNWLSADLIDQLAYRHLDACQPAYDLFKAKLFGAGTSEAGVDKSYLKKGSDPLEASDLSRYLVSPDRIRPLFQIASRAAGAGPVTIKIIHDLDVLCFENRDEDRFDAIYHDPFSPEVAPELWSLELFQRLRQMLRGRGRLVTYCVKSEIQRRLRVAGFEVEKRRGPPGGKREVMVAHAVEPT